MDRGEIENGVANAVTIWIEFSKRQGRTRMLTEGAQQALVAMIENIERGPSPYWERIEPEDLQRFVVTILPNVLVDMDTPWRRFGYRWAKEVISSWEIWHRVSGALEKWCPVPKDI